MVEEKKPIIWMILFGIVRALLVWLAAKLQDHGLIDAETQGRIINEGTAQVVGYVILGCVMIWSALQKKQVMGWVRTALGLDPKAANPGDIPTISEGPNIPI